MITLVCLFTKKNHGSNNINMHGGNAPHEQVVGSIDRYPIIEPWPNVINGHCRYLIWRYLPYTRPILQGYGSGDMPPISMAVCGTVPPL